MNYVSRIADELLKQKLEYAGAVLIEGAKGCGKTQTARNFAASELLLDINLTAKNALLAGLKQPLEGATPRLIDEWQIAPLVWNLVRREVDDRQKKGQFILTGSAKPQDDITRHSGARRFSRLRMRPMSLYESSISSGKVSLSELMSDADVNYYEESDMNFDTLSEIISRGGWPGAYKSSTKATLIENLDYVDELVHNDIKSVDNIKRSSDRVRLSFEAIARHTSMAVSVQTLIEDMSQSSFGGKVPSDKSLESYISALEKLMILEPLPAWSPHMRSKVGLRLRPHLHFVDPALAIAALRKKPSDILADFGTFGLLFESMVIRDLRVYSSLIGGEIRFFGNYNADEIDAVVDCGNQTWGAFEIKLNSDPQKIDKAAKKLLRIISKIDTTKVGQPKCVAIITGVGTAYRREDGVYIIPIGTLGP